MRLAFMGTPDFSVPVLAELIAAGHDIAAVYARAPAPSGRGHKLKPSPVHAFAEASGIEARTPANFKSQEEIDAFAALDLDAAIVVAYGMILPEAVLDAPRHGCLNLHASLLPRWRGAAPIQRAIMAGDKVTGVQVMQMEAGLDTGPILLSETVPIAGDDTAGSLHDKLSAVAAQLGPRALAALERGGLIATPQSENGVTYANKISSAEARIDWARPASEVDCHIRGLSPFPGAWFEVEGERVKALMSKPAQGEGVVGKILDTDGKLVVACGDGAIELVTLQRAGKKAQGAEDFLRGFPLEKGAHVS
ncbi:MAG: methionyl-tRNA formyltransferase [Parvularcula sp.]|uniref:methionyl-tRNA formyltransferase n=1 Tax=Hyphococcus sp. TaxID=2038636 RepID=UPI000C4D3B2F|nr:methionyl-tRNA formyltransferase [Parvularcula sp.]